MLLTRIVGLAATCVVWQRVAAIPASVTQRLTVRQQSDEFQDIVKWDQSSLCIRGERILFYSGEFHPFRLPVQDLWLDVFQKIKSLGYNGVSFYVNWALLEGEEGVFRADGIFALEPFFQAASEAGIYLLARPGPYINAEVSGGGYPGWLTRVNGTFRTNDTGYLDATDLYMQQVGSIIEKAQITNGGPVILWQPENEYTYPANNITFPNDQYFQYVIDQARDVNITVPVMNNDAGPLGLFAPGNDSFTTHVDIYGHDGYPLGFNCRQPYNWTNGSLPTNWHTLHERQSPSTAYSIVEFQGGSFDPWGGYGFDNCAALTNEQFERIFYKNNWSFRVGIQNIYMTYGGTNWGNLGHPLGYTSYDYGAVVKEDRSVSRAKYSEAKLGANFLRVTPSYLTSTVLNHTNTSYVSTDDLTVTPLIGKGSDTALYVVRHTAYNSYAATPYTLVVNSSIGTITIPQLRQLADHLTLDGRDSKVHVVDYSLNEINLLYSSGEIFTWQRYADETVLVLYGGENETHEFAVPSSNCTLVSGDASSIAMNTTDGHDVVQWLVTPEAKVLQCGELTVHLLWRNDAYNWWVLELPAEEPLSNYSSSSKTSIIVNGGYLLRTAQLRSGDLYLTGDLNQTTTIKIAGAPSYDSLYFNGKQISSSNATLDYTEPQMNLPDLSSLKWYSLDSLPEKDESYSDALWTTANDSQDYSRQFQPATPEVLWAGQYGYHSGSLMYRGHFSTPADTTTAKLSMFTQGGQAYGYSVWLNSSSIFQFPGISTSESDNVTLQLSNLTASANYVITLLIDHMGLTENFNPGNDTMREPRGLISYNLTTSASAPISVMWKVTGNLGGEQYVDKTRGPLNEGGMYFERQGYHLPDAPINDTSIFPSTDSPYTGYSGPGLQFYSTQFDLDLPTPEYDIPLAFAFTNTSLTNGRPTSFRCLLFVNGFQFGKFVNHIGPQLEYPVPEGILNYHGSNYIGISLWNMEEGDSWAMLSGLELKTSSTPVISGRGVAVRLSYKLPEDGWHQRLGAY